MLEELEIALADRVLLDVDLQALAVLLQVREAGLAHVAQGLQAAGDADARLRRQLFGGLRAVLGENSGNGVREFESLAVGPVAQLVDLRELARCAGAVDHLPMPKGKTPGMLIIEGATTGTEFYGSLR